MGKNNIPIAEKYTLTIAEAAAYFNIGETKLRRIISENYDANFVLQNGVKVLIKRKQFEKMIDDVSSI